jgi:hypothetical protein
VKLQFDPNQSFQLDAVAAVTDLFDGQPQGAPEYAVINLGSMEGLFDPGGPLNGKQEPAVEGDGQKADS